jgi:hypothetical protein
MLMIYCLTGTYKRLPSLLRIACNLVDFAVNCLQCQKTDLHSSKVKLPVRTAQPSPMAFPMQMVFLVKICSYYLIPLLLDQKIVSCMKCCVGM